MADEDAETFALPLAWLENEDAAVLFANQFLLQQLAEREFLLSIGQATPPAVIGGPEERREQLERIRFVPVRTLMRLSLTRERLDDLAGVLQRVRDAADEQGAGPPQQQP